MHCVATSQEWKDYERHVSIHNDAFQTKYILILHLPLNDCFASYELQISSLCYNGQTCAFSMATYRVSLLQRHFGMHNNFSHRHPIAIIRATVDDRLGARTYPVEPVKLGPFDFVLRW